MIIKLDKLKSILLLLIGFFLTILIPIPFRIAIARLQVAQPQAILVLGGEQHRERFAAKLAQEYTTLPIWISSGSNDKLLEEIFTSASVDLNRVSIDRRAEDTVTNFTSLVKDFKKQKIRHLYLITSDYHMLRASSIGTLVLGSKGIAFTTISVPGKQPPESQLRVLRDTARALVWIVTGYTGVSFKKHLVSKK